MGVAPQTEPLVSVVTPVYNGDKFLAECIESILGQTYSNWEYVIVNNGSKDHTLAIAQRYAQQDSRIRIHDNAAFLDLMPNWNHAMRQISPESTYCKVVHADDWLFPDCLARMVEVAEAHPAVGLVGAYCLYGKTVGLDGLAYPSTVVSGWEIGRAFMFHIAKLGGLWMFGSPSATMIRSDLVRQRETFYNEANLHADSEAACEILQHADLGFVHQVLTYTRDHGERQSTFAVKYHTDMLYELMMLNKYGPVFLSEQEYQLCLKKALPHYYQNLARSVFQFHDKKFWRYHTKLLREMGHPFSQARFVKGMGAELSDMLLNPKQTVQRIVRKFHREFRYEIQK